MAGIRSVKDLGALVDTSMVDDFLDELLPESVDWRHLVTRYPLPSLAVAAAAGFWLARSRSQMVLAALGSYVAASVGEAVGQLGEQIEHAEHARRH